MATPKETPPVTASYTVEICDCITTTVTELSQENAESYVTHANQHITEENVSVVDVEEFDLPDEYAHVQFVPQEKTYNSGYFAIPPHELETPGVNSFIWAVPLEEVLTEDGYVLSSDSAETDRLKDQDRTPQWVQEWDGPFRIDIDGLYGLTKGEFEELRWK